MSKYVFKTPLQCFSSLVGELCNRYCVVSGSGSDDEVASYLRSSLIPKEFDAVTVDHFNQFDEKLNEIVGYFYDDSGRQWSMSALSSACSASDILPEAITKPFPAEWLDQRFAMLEKLHIAGGGVMTTAIDGYGESTVSFDAALSSAVANASTYEDIKASRCLVFAKVGSTYCASANVTSVASALSPNNTPIWGNPTSVIFKLSAFRNDFDYFDGGKVVVDGGTMTILEDENTFSTGSSSYRFLDPQYSSGWGVSSVQAGMEEFWDNSAQVFLDYTFY